MHWNDKLKKYYVNIIYVDVNIIYVKISKIENLMLNLVYSEILTFIFLFKKIIENPNDNPEVVFDL